MRHTHVSYTRASDMVSTLCIAVFVVVHVAATQVARAIISGRARGHSCVGMKIDFTASLISVTISKMKKEMKKAVDERKKRIEQARAETCKIPEIYVYWLRTRQTLHPRHACQARLEDTHRLLRMEESTSSIHEVKGTEPCGPIPGVARNPFLSFRVLVIATKAQGGPQSERIVLVNSTHRCTPRPRLQLPWALAAVRRQSSPCNMPRRSAADSRMWCHWW